MIQFQSIAAPLLAAAAFVLPSFSHSPLSARPVGGAVEPAVSDVVYEIRFDSELAVARTVRVAMSFDVSEAGEVALSLPAWTPGAYELSNFARNVSRFRVESPEGSVSWDRLDHDTWRVRTSRAGRVNVRFDFRADTLDNAMAWTRPDFLMVNGTNVFLWPESAGYDFGSTVRVETESDWTVATGMDGGPTPGTWSAASYHDLVDMPWFIGRFDLDSMRVDGRMNRLATYPAGAMQGESRKLFWTQLTAMMPVMSNVFGETPWETYTTLLIFDDEYPGGSALEHSNSHVGIYNTGMVGNLVLPLITAHEIFHAWNVKRMRPADMVPYRYDEWQPTPWLWVSEGITDYYADLALVRSEVAPREAFYAITTGKLLNVRSLPPVALEDASLSTWIHPTDGTGYIYYDKGSLAGFALDILIRDASDNRRSLDDVMRELYHAARSTGGGFTGDDWWGAIERASGGRSFDDFRARYIDGRPPYPLPDLLPLAGMRLVADTMREARIGVTLRQDGGGVHVQAVAEGGMAALGGVRPGDRMLSVGDVPVKDLSFGEAYRTRYSRLADGTPVTIKVERDGRWLALEAPLRIIARVEARVEPDPSAAERAARIRDGILTGRVDTR
jgi:predicted metalloprotease with PDZ domain